MSVSEINLRLMKLLAQADTDIEKLILGFETTLAKSYKVSLDEIKKEIALMFEKYGNDVRYSDMMIYNRLTNLENSIAKEIKKLTGESITTTRDAIKDIYSESFYRTGFSLESSVGMKLGFGLLTPTVIQAVVLNPLDRISWPERMRANSQVFAKQITQELAQGLIQGKGYGKIASIVTEKTGISANNSIRIIKTEGHRVQNAARVLGFDASEKAARLIGFIPERVWRHPSGIKEPRDGTKDPDINHVIMNDVPADSEGIFILSDGTKTYAPGLTGIAKHDIHCHCTTYMRFRSSSKVYKPTLSQDLSFPEWYVKRIAKK
jgi:hypothetical protein